MRIADYFRCTLGVLCIKLFDGARSLCNFRADSTRRYNKVFVLSLRLAVSVSPCASLARPK